jgi:regulatory protein
LRERGCEEAEVEATIGHLVEAGELDDERFARRYAEDKRELRGWGPERIAKALQGRGLDRALIDAALASDGHEAQVERAMGLLGRRGEALVDEAARARALAFLTRRGYDYEVAYDAIRRSERSAEAA